MKTKILLIIVAAVGVFGGSGVVMDRLTLPVLAANEKLAESAIEQVEREPESVELAADDSEASWGGHEPLKDCTACHGDQSAQSSSAKPELVSPVPELCYGCHKEHLELDGWKHGPVATGKCLVCHEPHKANHKSLLRKPIPQLCFHCHEAKTLGLVANHASESYSRCDACHDEHAAPGRMLLKDIFLKSDAGVAHAKGNPAVQPRPVLVDPAGSLAGLKGVEIVPVVYKSDFFKSYGVTEDLVKTIVETQLKRDGVRVLQHKEETTQQASLEVHLRLMEVPSQRRYGQVDALTGSLNVFLRQKVELQPISTDGQRRFCMATTWDTGATVIWGRAQIEDGLKEAVKVLVGNFSSVYLEADSKERISPSISDK